MNKFKILKPEKDTVYLQGEEIELEVEYDESAKITAVLQAGTGNIVTQRLTGSEGRYKGVITTDTEGSFELAFEIADGPYGSSKRARPYRMITVQPDWAATAVVYNLFLRTGGQSGAAATLQEVLQQIDRIQDAGITALYINPFYDTGAYLKKNNLLGDLPPEALKNTPYAVRDLSALDAASVAQDPALQNAYQAERILKEFVNAAHNRGIRVIFDLILNHASHDFPLQRFYPEWFYYKQDILSTDSPYLQFSEGRPWGDPAHTVVPFENGEFYWSDTAKLNWEFNAPPAPNDPPGNPSLKQMFSYFITVATYWVREYGIDGYRCDLAHNIPAGFWRECIPAVKSAAREAYPHNDSIDGSCIFIAEAPAGDRERMLGCGFDYCYSDLADNMLADGLQDYLHSYAERETNITDFNFSENYDFHAKSHSADPVHPGSGAQRSRPWTWALTATLPGLAMFYSGFEKLSWHGIPGADLGIITDADLVKTVKKINHIRKTEPAVHGRNMQLLHTTGQHSETVVAYSRYNKHETVFVIINRGTEAITDTVLLSSPYLKEDQQYVLKDLVTGDIYLRKSKELTVILEPGAFHIFKLEQQWGDHSS